MLYLVNMKQIVFICQMAFARGIRRAAGMIVKAATIFIHLTCRHISGESGWSKNSVDNDRATLQRPVIDKNRGLSALADRSAHTQRLKKITLDQSSSWNQGGE